MDHAKFDAARGFGSAGSLGARNDKAQAVEEARLRAKAEMEAAGAAYNFELTPVCGLPTPIPRRGGRQSRNRYGAVVTEEGYEQALLDEREKKANKEGAAAAAEGRVAAAWEKQRQGIRAVEAQLDGVSTPTKVKALRVGELKSFIYSRTGHHPKVKSNKDDALLNEAIALLQEKLPPTPPDRRSLPSLRDPRRTLRTNLKSRWTYATETSMVAFEVR